jgi:hypothetical protein
MNTLTPTFFMLKWILIFGLIQPLTAQTVTSISSRYSDSFVAWDLFGPDTLNPSVPDEEILVGYFQMRWLEVQEDWTEWDFEVDGRKGTIRIKWKNDPSEWELRTYDGKIVTMKTIWRGNFTQWRITDNTQTFTYRSTYTNDLGNWSCNSSAGYFEMEVWNMNDPRDWQLVDQMESVDFSIKLAMIFLTTYYSSPKA